MDAVQWNKTVGNIERSTKHGETRKGREWGLFPTTATGLVSWRQAMDELDGYSRGFYLTDDEGETWFTRLEGPAAEVHDGPGTSGPI